MSTSTTQSVDAWQVATVLGWVQARRAVLPCQVREESQPTTWEATLQLDLKGQAGSPGCGAGGGKAWAPGEASWQKAGGMGFPE